MSPQTQQIGSIVGTMNISLLQMDSALRVVWAPSFTRAIHHLFHSSGRQVLPEDRAGTHELSGDHRI